MPIYDFGLRIPIKSYTVNFFILLSTHFGAEKQRKDIKASIVR